MHSTYVAIVETAFRTFGTVTGLSVTLSLAPLPWVSLACSPARVLASESAGLWDYSWVRPLTSDVVEF